MKKLIFSAVFLGIAAQAQDALDAVTPAVEPSLDVGIASPIFEEEPESEEELIGGEYPVGQEEESDDLWMFVDPFPEDEGFVDEVDSLEETEEEFVPEEEGNEDGADIIEDGKLDLWYPGGWNLDWIRRGGGPEIYHTMAFDGESPQVPDPVVYLTVLPSPPKLSLREKRAAFEADVAVGCEMSFIGLDRDLNAGLDLEEFSTRRPGLKNAHPVAFRRIDRDGNGLLSLAEFCNKGFAPFVLPAKLNLLEVAEARAGFDALNWDGNGFLTFGEFISVLKPSGPGVLEALFSEVDLNGDGKISFAEYTHRLIRPAGTE